MRIAHWLVLAEWAEKRGLASAKPAVLKLSVLYATQTRQGLRPLIWVLPIGRATEAISAAYGRFGVQLGDPDRVKQRGYALLRALMVAAFERRGKGRNSKHVVKHVGAWLAFAAALKTLVLGDGHVSLTVVEVATSDVGGLADTIGGYRAGDEVVLRPTMLRVLPPLLPTLFERDVALYRVLALHVKGLEITVSGGRWLLCAGNGNFRTSDSSASKLAEALRSVIGDALYTNGVLQLSESKAFRLVELGLARLLSEPEYEVARLGLTQAELEALVEAAALARYISFGEAPYTKHRGGREHRYTLHYALLYYSDEEKLNRALEALARIGYKPTVYRDRKRIMVQRRA